MKNLSLVHKYKIKNTSEELETIEVCRVFSSHYLIEDKLVYFLESTTFYLKDKKTTSNYKKWFARLGEADWKSPKTKWPIHDTYFKGILIQLGIKECKVPGFINVKEQRWINYARGRISRGS